MPIRCIRRLIHFETKTTCSLNGVLMKKLILTFFASFFMSAHAADITGAGATFPYPIYAKWAEVYHKQTGIGLNYQSIGSSGGIRQINQKTVTFGATHSHKKSSVFSHIYFPLISQKLISHAAFIS